MVRLQILAIGKHIGKKSSFSYIKYQTFDKLPLSTGPIF